MLEQLTTICSVGIIPNMKATILINERHQISDNAFIELVVWDVPTEVIGSDHQYKYRLALIVDQVCIMRYDNERGKGGHKHIGDKEISYAFVDIKTLIDDFLKDVEELT
jgi:hypothetical protein